MTRPKSSCVAECRALADASYDLAQKANNPAVIGEFLEVAGRLLACAERAERGEPEPWPGRPPA